MVRGAQFANVSGTVQWKRGDMKVQSGGFPGGSGGNTRRERPQDSKEHHSVLKANTPLPDFLFSFHF